MIQTSGLIDFAYRISRLCEAQSQRAGRLQPPEVAIEILSPEDRAAGIQDRIDDYLAFGIPCVWVINPETHRAWIHTNDGSREAKDGVLRNLAGDLEVSLTDVFAD